MLELLEHINQDIKWRQSKDKDSTVNKTEYWSKRKPTDKSNKQPKQASINGWVQPGLPLHTRVIFYVRREVDLMNTAKVNAYIMHIFGKIELLSIHAT